MLLESKEGRVTPGYIRFRSIKKIVAGARRYSGSEGISSYRYIYTCFGRIFIVFLPCLMVYKLHEA